MEIVEIELAQLEAHPLNSNVMGAEMVAKLAAHLKRTGRYPPVIVRRVGGSEAASGGEKHQILDGHHRVAALRSIGASRARCVVWEVDDEEALLLLATLNRLSGQDDPRKRSKLILALSGRRGVPVRNLSVQLPERGEQVEALANLSERPRLVKAREVDDLPVSVHFFLMPEQRDRLEAKLRAMGGAREWALMKWVDGS